MTVTSYTDPYPLLATTLPWAALQLFGLLGRSMQSMLVFDRLFDQAESEVHTVNTSTLEAARDHLNRLALKTIVRSLQHT